MFNRIRVGVRPSPLAIKQAQEIERLLADSVHFEIELIQTWGDMDKVTPLSNFEGSDFFTREIESSLLEGRIDAAVHSAKDLGEVMPPQLAIAAITASISPWECLVSRQDLKLNELPLGAIIGTSSRKRKDAILEYRPDLRVCDIRGTIEERLRQLDEGSFEAIVMAHAALIRLGQEKRVAEIISAAIIEPHPLQGALAVQVRCLDRQLIQLFSKLHMMKTCAPIRNPQLIGVSLHAPAAHSSAQRGDL